MRKHQHHRKLGDLAGLQRSKARQHQPAFAAVVLRHKEYRCQQHHGKPQQRPCQLMIDVVIHPAGRPHGPDAQRRIQQLGPQVGKGIVPPVQRHGAAGTAQHHQPRPHQRQHQQQKGQIHGRQLPQTPCFWAMCRLYCILFVHFCHLPALLLYAEAPPVIAPEQKSISAAPAP